MGRIGAHVNQLTAYPDVGRRQAAVHRSVIRQAVASVAFVHRVSRVAVEGISPCRNANAAYRRASDGHRADTIGRRGVGAGVAPCGAGVVGRKNTLPTRRAVLVFGTAQGLVVGAFARHLRIAENRHADGAVCQAVPIGVDQGTGVTRVAARPARVVELPQERERSGRRGTRRAGLAQLAQVLLARDIVGTLSVEDTAGSDRSGGQKTEREGNRQ